MSVTTVGEASQIVVIALLVMSLVFSASAYLFIRKQLTQNLPKQQESLENKIKKTIQEELDKNLFVTQEVHSDGVLPASSTILGVGKLEAYAQKVRPKFIVGINRGGWLLSTYLAHRLDIKRSRILRYNSEEDALREDDSRVRVAAGDRILLVDDISRTGKALSAGNSYVRRRFPDNNLFTAVLVVCKEKREDTVNFSAYYTKDPDVQLPWSSEDRKQRAREKLSEHRQKKALLVGHSKQSLEEEADVLRLAHEGEEQAGSGIDISIDDMEQLLSINNLERLLGETRHNRQSEKKRTPAKGPA